MDRKKFFTKGIRDLMGDAYKSPVGRFFDRRLEGISNALAPLGMDGLVPSPGDADDWSDAGEHGGEHGEKPPVYARPPGALPGADFEEACTRCGDCIIACPHGALFQLDSRSGPLLDPNFIACKLCKDWPCINACEEGALEPLAKRVLPRFGRAELNADACLNEGDNRLRRKAEGAKRLTYCKECAKACPVKGVVSFDKLRMPVFGDDCTGCGLCVAECPPVPKAIEIV